MANLRALHSMLILASFGSGGAMAQEAMTGYVAGGGAFVMHTQASESGSRLNYKLEFARVVKNISAELRFGTGLNYKDYGGTLKGFWHFNFQDPTTSATGISLGLGAGAMHSGTGTVLTGMRGFTDIVIHPFVRFLWDSRFNVGGVIEAGMDWVPYRTYTGTGTTADSTTRLRFYVGAGIAIGA